MIKTKNIIQKNKSLKSQLEKQKDEYEEELFELK